MKVIVYAHPYQGSFNHGILNQTIQILKDRKEKYQVIDLYQDEFNPVFTGPELANFAKGIALDKRVIEYQKILKKADQIIFIFPIWWSTLPAILKGFIDKVMLKNYAYEENSVGLKGLLINIKRTTVITTSNSPKWYLRYFAGNSIQGTFMNTVLKSLGMKRLRWIHYGNIKKTTLANRERFLESLSRRI